MTDEKLDAVFDAIDEATEQVSNIDRVVGVQTDTIALKGPHPSSPEWSDWVMSLFEDGETFNGYPVAAGLRRVSELVVGTIVKSAPVKSWQTDAIDGIPGSATQWEITFHAHDGNIKVFGDVGDATAMNCEDDYIRYSLATSATRAEARALRKALKLKKVAAEEMTELSIDAVRQARTSAKYNTNSSGEYNSTTSSSSPSDRQIGFLTSISKELDINIDKAFAQILNVNNKRDVDKTAVSSLLDALKGFRSDPGSVPGDIVGFENWSMK